MAGFDNGTLYGAPINTAKQFGAILRGFGPPVPQAGHVGDLYIDVQTWFLYEKRSPDAGGDVDPWGHYLFQVPPLYRTSLKWFTTAAPTNDFGVNGDYCLAWAAQGNYGIIPAIYGPKQWSGWPTNGDGPGTVIAQGAGATVKQVGLTAENASLVNDLGATALIMVGIVAPEFTVPVPVTMSDGDAVGQVGLQSGPTLVQVVINSLYTAEDSHAI